MAHRFCDDHEWVGGGNEYCPQCDEAFRCIVPEAATPPTNPEIAQLQARVAELETAIARIETEALADDGVLAESALFESIMDARNV